MSGQSGEGQPAARQANKRGAARLAAVQALYQMDVAGSGVLEIAAEYEAFRLGKEVDGALYREADAQWFRAILSGVVENQKTVDPVIRQALTEDWPLSRLDSTLRAILRAGVYEIMKRDDVPVAVIVSEYVDIAKAFYADDEPKLVNAVLDRVSRRLRGEGRGKDAFVSRTPAEREARRTAIILCGVAGDRRLGGGRGHLARRAGRPVSARRRQVAGHGARSPASTSAWRSARLPAAAIIRALGQRNGFITGCLVTAAGGGIAAAGLFAANFWLFALGLLVIGLGGAFVQQYRFAAADNAPPEFKARAISFVLAGGVFTAIVGPQVVIFTRELLAPVMFAGSFVAVIFMALIGMSILFLLRLQAAARGERPMSQPSARHARSSRSSRSRASSWR